MVLQDRVNYEYWLQVMDVLSILPLGPDINFRADGSLGNFWELSLHIVSECSKLFDIHTSSSLQIVVHVLDQGFPNN